MKPPFIVNENISVEPGALYVFRTVAALESYLEPWYVDEPHFIYDSDGMRLEITAHEHCVRLASKEPRELNPDLARTYFAAFLGLRDDTTTTLSELAAQSDSFADR